MNTTISNLLNPDERIRISTSTMSTDFRVSIERRFADGWQEVGVIWLSADTIREMYSTLQKESD